MGLYAASVYICIVYYSTRMLYRLKCVHPFKKRKKQSVAHTARHNNGIRCHLSDDELLNACSIGYYQLVVLRPIVTSLVPSFCCCHANGLRQMWVGGLYLYGMCLLRVLAASLMQQSLYYTPKVCMYGLSLFLVYSQHDILREVSRGSTLFNKTLAP